MSYDKKCHKVHVLWTFCVNGLKWLVVQRLQTVSIVVVPPPPPLQSELRKLFLKPSRQIDTMPMQTRNRRQSTLSFPTRKTQTPGRSLQAHIKDIKPVPKKVVNGTETPSRVHHRSKSLSSFSLGSKCSEEKEQPVVRPLSTRLDRMLSPRRIGSFTIWFDLIWFQHFSKSNVNIATYFNIQNK